MIDVIPAKEVHDLASFLEIGIAYGTGYLAFNYFKYRERISSLRNEYLRRYSIDLILLQSPETSKSIAPRAEIGPFLQIIAECFTDHRLQNRFVSFIYCKPPAIDKIIIFYLTCINILLLAFVSLLSIELPLSYSFAIAALPASTIIIASSLALWLNKILYEYDRTLEITYQAYLPYDSDGTSSPFAEQRATLKSVLISLAVFFVKHREDEGKMEEIKKKIIPLLKEVEEDSDTLHVLSQHALIRYVRKQISK